MIPDFEFRNPTLLLLALLAIPAWWLVRHRQAAIIFSSVRPLESLPASWRSRLAWLPAALFSAAVIALALAVARPQTSEKLARVEREGVAIMMVMDRSGSMHARDMVQGDRSVDRLTVAKDVFNRFVLGDRQASAGTGRPNDLIGLVTFAGYADSICPLTLDHNNLALLASELEIVSQRGEDGTAIGDGLALAVERLRKSEVTSRVAILLTDGENTAGVIDPLKAAELAREVGVKVYCIGAGTNGWAPIPQYDPRRNRTVLIRQRVRIDEATLKEIAKRTGGAYFRATDSESLADIYGQINELEKTEISELRFVRFHQWFAPFATVGLALMGLAAALDSTAFRRWPEG